MLISEILVGGPVEPWRAIGAVDTRPRLEVEGCALVVDEASSPGMCGLGVWTDGDAVPADIDGVPVWSSPLVTGSDVNQLGVIGWDHIVLRTSSLDRTCGAVADALGAPLKRIREVGNGVRQGFHRVGGLVIEVVESPQVTSDQASLWGFVWNVADLDEQAGRLGTSIVSSPRDAVQPGRRIASFRSEVGLGTAVALMTTSR
jgi:hypothetical protein